MAQNAESGSSRYCGSCGASLQSGDRYCANCGAPVGASAQATPSAGTPSSADERTWAMFAHLASFAGFVFPLGGNIIGPLVVWLVKRYEMPFVNVHGRASLNFQISMFIYAVISVPLMIVLVGLLLLLALAVLNIVMVIVNTVHANNGEEPRYILAIPFLR